MSWAKGMVMLVLIVFVLIALAAGVAYGIGAFFGSKVLTVVLGAAVAAGLSYRFINSRVACITCSFAGVAGGIAANVIAAAAGGFAGAVLGVFAGVAVFLLVVAAVICAMAIINTLT